MAEEPKPPQKVVVTLPADRNVHLTVTSDLSNEQQLHENNTPGYEAPPNYYHKTRLTFPQGRFQVEFVTPEPATEGRITYGDLVFNSGDGGDFTVEVFERKGAVGAFSAIGLKLTAGANNAVVRAEGHPLGPPPGLGVDWDDTVADFSW